MIAIKGMGMPLTCWDCELTYDDSSGCTRCACTKQRLYPMGTDNDREAMECPLVEIEI